MSGFSREELSVIPDGELVEAIIGVVTNSSIGLEDSDTVQILDGSPEGFGIVQSVFLLDLEVRNGGFHQYFWNHRDAYVDLTRRSLRRLEALDHLAVFESAVLVSRAHPPEDAPGDAEAQLRGFSNSAMESSFDAVDSRWYDLADVGPLLVAFVRNNPESVWEED